MPAPTAPAAPVVAIPAADPLFADTLRAATESYIRGDYTRAANLWLDAAALATRRPDCGLFRVLGHGLELLVSDVLLVDRHAPIERDAQVRR